MDNPRIAVVMTCHNRREKTLACVESLSAHKSGTKLDFIIADSGSTDGTPQALEGMPQDIRILHCSEDCFWNAGMREGLNYVLEHEADYDHCLLVNDDVVFFPEALSLLLEKAGENRVVVGSTCDAAGRMSYGAVGLRSRHFARFAPLPPGCGRKIDTFNGNCVLLPLGVLKAFGPPDPVYVHSMADYDYGLTLSRGGVELVQASGFVGNCEDNPVEGSWRDKSLGFWERLRKKESPKGLPAGDWYHFIRKNFGLLPALYHSLTPYLRILSDSFGGYALAFLLPVLLFGASSFMQGVYPFGEKLWHDVDLEGQFVSFYSYLHEALHGRASMLYSYAKVMGGSMPDMTAYYLANPLLLVFYFFDAHSMPRAVFLLSCISLGLAGLSCFSVFRKKIHSTALPLSVCYALCSCILLYHYKFMWVPGFILLPQVMEGIEELFAGKRKKYLICLALALITGYYIGFMLCIASVLYFLSYGVFLRRETDRPFGVSVCFHFAMASLLAGLVSSFMLLPGILGLRGAKLEYVSLSHLLELTPRFPVWWLFPPMLPFTFRGEWLGSVQPPLIYCGLLPLLFGLLFFFGRTPWNRKLGYGLLLIILLASMVCVGPYQLWHGGAYPAGFETRFAFIYVFFVLLIAGEAADALPVLKGRPLQLLFILWVLGELSANAVFSFGQLSYCSLAEYRMNLELLEKTVELIPEDVRKTGARIAFDAGDSLNAGWMLNVPSLSSYTSNEKVELRNYMQHAGLPGNLAWLNYELEGANAAMEDLFGAKYILLKPEQTPRKHWIRLGEIPGEEGYSGVLYQNPDALPLAFLAPGDAQGHIKEVTTPEYASEDPEVIENALWNGLCPEAGDVYHSPGALHEAAQTLLRNAPEILLESAGELRIRGTHDRKEAAYLVIMIPEESRCWSILSEGGREKSESALGLFTQVAVPPGEYEVRMRYTPRGFTAGLLLTVFGILASLWYNMSSKKKSNGVM